MKSELGCKRQFLHVLAVNTTCQWSAGYAYSEVD